MDKKVTKKFAGVSKKYGAVASATGSGGPTHRRQAKLKIQQRVDVKNVEEATLVDLAKHINYKERQPLGKAELPNPPEETTPIDVDVLPNPFDAMLDYSPVNVTKRKKEAKTLSQRAAAEIKKKAVKRARNIPTPDLFNDLAANIASKEIVEKQLAETTKKLQELTNESQKLKLKEEELLISLRDLRKAAEDSAAVKKDLEEIIEISKTELEQTKLESSAEIQRIRLEAAAEKEENNKRIKEIEDRNASILSELEQEKSRSDRTTQAEIERQAAEEITNNKIEIEHLRRNFDSNNAARDEEIFMLQREKENRIRELEEKYQNQTEAYQTQRSELLEDIQVKTKDVETLRKELLSNKSNIDAMVASMDEKKSLLDAEEAKTKNLEKQLVELQEERRLLDKWARDELALSERKMKKLQAQLEQQKEKEAEFYRSVEANNEELRENFKREKEILQKELEETARARIAATQIAERARIELEEANRLAEEAEKRRIIAEKKELERTNELQEMQRKAKEDNERLNREKQILIMKLEDVERQQEMLEKEKQEAMTVKQYAKDTVVISEIPSHQNVVSEVNDAIGTIRNAVIAQNQIHMDEVKESILDLKSMINSSGQKLADRQDSSLTAGIRQFGDLIKNSTNIGVEIQETMNEMIKHIDVKTSENQTSVSNALEVVRQLGDRIVEGMDHDDPSDTNQMRLAWNLIKQSLINVIGNAFAEIDHLKMAIRKSKTIRDKEYVDSAERAANRAFSLFVNNKVFQNVLEQLGIRVTFSSRSTGITPYDPATIDPGDLEVEVKSVGNDLEKDIKTLKIKMSMAFATYKEIEIILSGVRVITVQFANTERQSLHEIESGNVVVASMEDLTASRLYYELKNFSYFVNSIENVGLFLDTMNQNPSLRNTFNDAIPFMVNRKDNREIMEFLKKKGYSVRDDMANSIEYFFSDIMGVRLTEDSDIKMDENTFLPTVIGILSTISDAIQRINKKVEREIKQKEIRANQKESRQYLEDQLQSQKELIILQKQPTQMSIAGEIDEVENATEIRNEIKQITNIVKDSAQDINTLIDSAVRETKNTYEGTLDTLKKQYEESFKIIQTQQRQFQEQLQMQKEQQQREQLEQEMTTIDMLPPKGPGGGRDEDCLRRVFNAVIDEFRSDVKQVQDNLKMSVERLIATLHTTSSRIPASDFNSLKRAADTYTRDMHEEFKARSIRLPIDVLEKIKKECEEVSNDILIQLSRDISSVISEMDDMLSRYRVELYRRIAELQDRDMEFTETGTPKEDKSARLAREMKKHLTSALTRVAETAELNNTEDEVANKLLTNDGDRKIKMFLKPEEGSTKNFVEIDLSSKDNIPRNINTDGLKKALPDMPSDTMKKASSSRKPMSETATKNNTLTGKIFLSILKEKVFPYSSRSALDEEDGPAALHHPEYLRSSFSKHFIRDSTSFSEPPTFAEKLESVRNFTRLLEYSLFNDRGGSSDNDMLSRLIYVVFEHDAKMIRYLSDITYKFREYANVSISLYRDRGNLLEATVATIFSAALPMISSMASRIAEAMSEPVHDDVRIRCTYSLLSLIEKFIYCASKRVHVLKNVMEKSGLVNRLSLYPTDVNADRVTSSDVRYDYSLLRMLLELVTINITNLIDMGIRPLKAVVLSIGTFTGAEKTRETDRAFIPIDGNRSVLSKVNDSNIDVPRTISVINYLSAVTDWYIADRFSGDDKESLQEAVHTLLAENSDNLAGEFNTNLKDKTSEEIIDYVSKTTLPKLNKIIEEIVTKTKSNDALLVKGASEVGSLGETAVNVSLGMSKEHLALPWLEVDFRGGIDDSTLIWVLSGGRNSDEVVRDYQLAVPLYSSMKRSAVVQPLVRVINNVSSSDMYTKKHDSNRLHVLHLADNVSCVLEYSNKDRYKAIIDKMYRDGLVLVRGNAEVPRVFPIQDGWMDNSTSTPLSLSRWKMPSASLVYGILSKRAEEQNQEHEKNTDFMGGKTGDMLLKMLTSKQPVAAATNKDGHLSTMMAKLMSDDKKQKSNAQEHLYYIQTPIF